MKIDSRSVRQVGPLPQRLSQLERGWRPPRVAQLCTVYVARKFYTSKSAFCDQKFDDDGNRDAEQAPGFARISDGVLESPQTEDLGTASVEIGFYLVLISAKLEGVTSLLVGH